MIIIKIPIRTNKREVQQFLQDINSIFNNPNFDLNRNFVMIQSSKLGKDRQYSTPFTLLDLEYDVQDVVERIGELTVENYSETLYDRDDNHPPLLYVFGMQVHERLIYIKLKIKKRVEKYILCVSFHYAKHDMNFPYKNS